MTHIPDEVLQQWLDGELTDPDALGPLEAHVPGCPRCTSVVGSLRAMTAALGLWSDALPLGPTDEALADAVFRAVAPPVVPAVPAVVIAPVASTPVAVAQRVGRGHGRVVPLRRWLAPALAAAAAVALALVARHPGRPRVKAAGVPMVIPAAAPAPAGASVARVDVVGAQSYAVLEVPGAQDGTTTSIVWIQDDPEENPPDAAPTAVE